MRSALCELTQPPSFVLTNLLELRLGRIRVQQSENIVGKNVGVRVRSGRSQQTRAHQPRSAGACPASVASADGGGRGTTDMDASSRTSHCLSCWRSSAVRSDDIPTDQNKRKGRTERQGRRERRC